MKPEFALSLSFDSIALLIRGAGGWRRVGTVSTEVDDLVTELAILRSRAEDLTDAPLHSKLILPDAQIRYLSVETGDLPHDARIEAARTALEGATPYEVTELAFDISPEGTQTHVAAVAIETLEEAESFASEHGFGPVSFVAVPGAHPFLGEPFFGTCRAARGLTVDPDGIAVVEIGDLDAEPPETETPDTQAPETEAPDLTPDAGATGARPETQHSEDTPETSAATDTGEPDLYPAEGVETELAPRGPAPIILPAAPPMAAPDEAADPVARASAPAAQDPADAPAAQAEDDTDDAPADGPADGPVIGFSSRRRTSPEAADGRAAGTKTQPTAPAPTTAPAEAASGKLLLGPATEATPAAPLVQASAPAQATAAAAASASSLPAAPNLALPTPVLAHTTSAPPKARANSSAPRAQAVTPPGGNIARMPQANPLRARPVRIGVAAAALATVSALGAWAVVQELPELWSDLKRADLVETEDPVAPPVLTHAQPQTSALLAEGFAAPGLSDADAPLTPGPDATLSDTATSAPGQLSEADLGDVSHQMPQDQPGALTVTDAAVLEALGTPVIDEVAPLDGEDLVIASLPAPRDLSAPETGQPDPARLTQQDGDVSLDPEALADGVVPGEAMDGYADDDALLAPDVDALEQAAQYAATGIWQQVPRIAELPALIDLDDVYVASIDHTDLSQDAVALPAQPEIETDSPFGAVSSPTDAGQTFDLDDRGLVTATPDGTLNPDGIMVFAGRPAKVPPPTPDRPTARELEQAQAAAHDARMRLVRPRTRPGDLVEQAERAQLGGVVRAELLSKRPKTRPASLKTEEQESQPATALAVARAPQPRARPANFANIVDRAARRQQQQRQTAAAAPAAVTPAIPSSASVARQATVQRALNLRRVNLIGVYGKPSDRRALVRLPSGRYVKVKVGDRIDGGRIVAIGDSQLQYQKSGRNRTLTLPNG
ncbi:hypothetical protein [Epibacterium sp. Ofav1-8]|uniref:hypothetical protein n=1 Tax=Epibacterium sp. Ofav1-8 TaxID=2917735 RepID=UPI001EF68125|nr:hypothetical protein [Epibacterium sp. Ofav1-8]MCG7624581.1 hypothetical protein [Epibacterium sp. Ofav1-8]